MLEEAKLFFFEEQQSVNEDETITSDEDEPMDVDTTSQRLESSNILNNDYVKSVILEGELYSAEMQALVSNTYGKLQFAFNNFRNSLKEITNNKKCLLNPNDKQL